jgi:hypothetical protein
VAAKIALATAGAIIPVIGSSTLPTERAVVELPAQAHRSKPLSDAIEIQLAGRPAPSWRMVESIRRCWGAGTGDRSFGASMIAPLPNARVARLRLAADNTGSCAGDLRESLLHVGALSGT